MTATTPPPEPSPDDIERTLDDIEDYVADHAPAPLIPFGAGETKRVQRLRDEVAEAHLLAELQDDDTPLILDSDKVRKRRKKAGEAARLHALAQDPAMRAWRASRMRRIVVAVALFALALALGWSTAGVQKFAADGAEPWSPGWLFAWFVEPFMSLALLVIVASRTYMATLGQPIESKTLVRIEWLFLGLTLGMNAFPYLPGVADSFRFPRLVFHILGPIVAVAIVMALPIILAAFTRLDVGLPSRVWSRGATGRSYRANAGSESGAESGATDPDDIAAKAAQVRALIAAGALPEGAGVEKIRTALRCATKTARAVRDHLYGGA